MSKYWKGWGHTGAQGRDHLVAIGGWQREEWKCQSRRIFEVEGDNEWKIREVIKRRSSHFIFSN